MWDKLDVMPGKLVVQFEEPDEQTAGGIVIPTTWSRDKDEGVVLAIGSGKFDSNGNYIECPVKVGDRILSNNVWAKTWTYEDVVNGKRERTKVWILDFQHVIARVKTGTLVRED